MKGGELTAQCYHYTTAAELAAVDFEVILYVYLIGTEDKSGRTQGFDTALRVTLRHSQPQMINPFYSRLVKVPSPHVNNTIAVYTVNNRLI